MDGWNAVHIKWRRLATRYAAILCCQSCSGTRALHAIRIYIVASHPLFAQGVSSILEAQPDIQVVGLSNFDADVLCEIEELKPDVVVIDSEQGTRGLITDTLLSRMPGLKLVGLSLEEHDITITYLQQRSGAAVEDLVTAVRSLPAFSWLPQQRQMRILAAVQGPSGQRMADNIRKNAPAHWNVAIWRAPPLIPPDRDSLNRLLPRILPAADLVLGLAESVQMVYLMPEIVGRSGARAALVPVESPRWVPESALRSLEVALAAAGVAIAIPRPFCSLTMRTYNEASWREVYHDAHITEFARYFGRPEMRILFDDAQHVTRCEVRRDSACGFSHMLAESLVGCPLDQAEEMASQLLREHSCPNGGCIDPIYQAPLQHVADAIVREAIRREVEPFVRRGAGLYTDSVPAQS